MTERIAKLRQQITIGVVGGSDLVKQKEQLGENGTFDGACVRSLASEGGHEA